MNNSYASLLVFNKCEHAFIVWPLQWILIAWFWKAIVMQWEPPVMQSQPSVM